MQAQCDAERGTVSFPWGMCEMCATATTLHFTCSAEREEQLASGREVIDGHMALFTRKAPITLDWSPPA